MLLSTQVVISQQPQEEQLASCQAELCQQRALYNQIKILQEQTDRALADAQSQLSAVQSELTTLHDRVQELERERSLLEREVTGLKAERNTQRSTLAQVDQERDTLLDWMYLNVLDPLGHILVLLSFLARGIAAPDRKQPAQDMNAWMLHIGSLEAPVTLDRHNKQTTLQKLLILAVDSKTEQLAALEQELKAKDTHLTKIKEVVADLQKKLA
uniref:Uncharacterized protein n=1 Tax=Timema bartmani TaxID=61472 RepID=A0A7R9I7I1_9NEOP|nr:unnamed protein product [Timema bartmani]